jgi:hypothetical protein
MGTRPGAVRLNTVPAGMFWKLDRVTETVADCPCVTVIVFPCDGLVASVYVSAGITVRVYVNCLVILPPLTVRRNVYVPNARGAAGGAPGERVKPAEPLGGEPAAAGVRITVSVVTYVGGIGPFT